MNDDDPARAVRSMDLGQRPAWDERRAEKLVGSSILIGIPRRNPDGDMREQLFGVITSAKAQAGILVALQGRRNGDTYRLSPHLGTIRPARPGLCHLGSTSEIVVDPDFITDGIIQPLGH